jgi:hypothetical protein
MRSAGTSSLCNLFSLPLIRSLQMWHHLYERQNLLCGTMADLGFSGPTLSRHQKHPSRSGRLGSFSSLPMTLPLRQRLHVRMDLATKTSVLCIRLPRLKPSPPSVALPNNPLDPSPVPSLVLLIARTLVRLVNQLTTLQTLVLRQPLGRLQQR